MELSRDDQDRTIDLDEALRRLNEAERVVAVLEARLVQYQSALESIRTTVGKALDS